MLVTQKGIRRAGTEAFARKAYAEYYDPATASPRDRTNEELCDELSVLCDLSAEPHTPRIEWNRAVVGLRDGIFPVPHMLACWGERALTADLPHYPFGDPKPLYDLLK